MATRRLTLGFMSIRHATLPDRVAAAAAAGFDAIALRADRWREMQRDGWNLPAIRELLDHHGLTVSEVEPLRLLREDLLDATLEMVQGLHVPRVQVTPSIDGSRIDLDAAAAWLGRAAGMLPGTQLAIEFLPPTDVPDAPAALALIDRAGGAPNLGLCVDSWHVFRGGGLASLQAIDPARVFMLQINDGTLQPAEPGYIEDCIRHRLPCGQGEFDLAALLRLLPPRTPVNVEVVSDALDQRPPGEVAQLLYESTVSLLEARGHDAR